MESLLPFLQGTCTPYNMPVYPGAQCIIAESLNENIALLVPIDAYTSGSPGESRESS